MAQCLEIHGVLKITPWCYSSKKAEVLFPSSETTIIVSESTGDILHPVAGPHLYICNLNLALWTRIINCEGNVGLALRAPGVLILQIPLFRFLFFVSVLRESLKFVLIYNSGILKLKWFRLELFGGISHREFKVLAEILLVRRFSRVIITRLVSLFRDRECDEKKEKGPSDHTPLSCDHIQ